MNPASTGGELNSVVYVLKGFWEVIRVRIGHRVRRLQGQIERVSVFGSEITSGGFPLKPRPPSDFESAGSQAVIKQTPGQIFANRNL
jgi:hypothetical protein